MSKSTISRRALVPGVVAALAMPSANPVASMAAYDTDAELLQLDVRHEALVAKWEDAYERSQVNWDAQSTLRQKLKATAPNSDEFWSACMEQVDRKYPIAYPTCDDVTDMMEETARKIGALPAHTLAGLAAKARVARFACLHYWDRPDDDADWDILHARRLIDAVLALARSSAGEVVQS